MLEQNASNKATAACATPRLLPLETREDAQVTQVRMHLTDRKCGDGQCDNDLQWSECSEVLRFLYYLCVNPFKYHMMCIAFKIVSMMGDQLEPVGTSHFPIL